MLRLSAHASCVGFVYELYFYILKPHVSNLIYQDIEPPHSQVTVCRFKEGNQRGFIAGAR